MAPSYNAVVIGASMGGLNALNTILSALPAGYCLPIMVVQHQLSEADDFVPEYLNRQSSIRVKYPYGSRGLKAIKSLGGLTIVQGPEGAEADIMPKAAMTSADIDHVLHLGEISGLIRSICNG
ncbi:MAG: hypothetical protein COA82_13065 [Alkaliphilus sp.]|nr:MAG: hypothetical protein COA82_13065 [Alkaliphilus sp.]